MAKGVVSDIRILLGSTAVYFLFGYTGRKHQSDCILVERILLCIADEEPDIRQ